MPIIQKLDDLSERYEDDRSLVDSAIDLDCILGSQLDLAMEFCGIG